MTLKIYSARLNCLQSRPQGAPVDVYLRRAVSTAYYGLFHFVMYAVANQFGSRVDDGTARYALLYRAVDHSTLRSRCTELSQSSVKIADYAPGTKFRSDSIRKFAAAVIQLQGNRNLPDHDPLKRFTLRDANEAIEQARSAIAAFNTATAEEQRAFLMLLLVRSQR